MSSDSIAQQVMSLTSGRPSTNYLPNVNKNDLRLPTLTHQNRDEVAKAILKLAHNLRALPILTSSWIVRQTTDDLDIDLIGGLGDDLRKTVNLTLIKQEQDVSSIAPHRQPMNAPHRHYDAPHRHTDAPHRHPDPLIESKDAPDPTHIPLPSLDC